ncbi:MAG: pilus assembly protein N-terminal domain-containing protein, partial [Candidatus Omnitrophica bacterium]|nr:pilus assembly protein N-terminal domain-containing protein [Candidatus Omnitrophota bacterium]
MRKIFLVVLLILFSVILPLRAQSLDNIAEEIELYIGEMRAIQVHSPTRIVIGNPSVIDVNVVNKNEITIIPKSAGATTFVYWDKFGEQSFKIKIFAENMKDIKFRVDNLLNKLNLSEVYTKAEEEEGKVLLLGRVKTSQERERIITILGTLK